MQGGIEEGVAAAAEEGRGIRAGALLTAMRHADRGTGRIFSYDVTGGRYEEQDFHAVGSGAMFARGSLKKEWRRGLGRDAAVEAR